MQCRIGKFIVSTLFYAASGVFVSCDKVNTLSDRNEIVAATVKVTEPAGIIFDTPEVEGERITLPLRFGKYLFPARISLDFTTEEKVSGILGREEDGFLTFEGTDNLKYVNVVAESGLTKRYEICIEVLPSRDLAEIEEFLLQGNSANTPVSLESYTDATKSEVTLYTPGSVFPVSITPLIKLSPGASFSGYKPGDPISFLSENSFKEILLTSESGRSQNWKLFLKNAVIINSSNSGTIPADVAERLNMAVKSALPAVKSGSIIIDTVMVSSLRREIEIYGSSTAASQIEISVKTGEYITTIWPGNTSLLNFLNWGELKEFYVTDLITGYTNRWKILLKNSTTLTRISSFSWNKIVSVGNSIVTGNVSIKDNDRKIFIPVIKAGTFPMELQEISVSVTNGTASFSGSTMVFDSMNTINEFRIERDGSSEIWQVLLQDNFSIKSNKADVTGFSTGNVSFGYELSECYIENSGGKIIVVSKSFPSDGKLWITPLFNISDGASLRGIVSGGVLGLTEGEEKRFSIEAENGDIKEWLIKMIKAPQIPGSDFEEWGIHPQFSTIPLTIAPSDGSGWNSSNNPSVQGVTRTAGFESDYAAQISTALTTVSFGSIVSVTSLTAGSLYLGKFRYSILTRDVYNPSRMALMGIPFDGSRRPLSFSFMYKYNPGSQLVRTAPKLSSVNIPAFETAVSVSGNDMAVARVELWYHDSSGEFDINKAPETNRIATGEVVVSAGSNMWSKGFSAINYIQGRENLVPTHIAVSFTSSRDGLLFTGAAGSTFTVDNFRLNYFNPSAGAIIIK